MIAKAKAISHGINALKYISGESERKKHPERIFLVKNNLVDASLDAEGIFSKMNYECMKSHPRMKNKVIRIELSPMKQYTKDYEISDWQDLWDDFIREFDAIEFKDKKTGKTISEKLNLAGSTGTVWLHFDSRSGVPHLHGAYCRVDANGRTNNDHDIYMRALTAAEKVAIKRGWHTAREVHGERVSEVRKACEDVLRDMQQWSWQAYRQGLKSKGFALNTRTDSKGKIVGYSVIKGNSIYHASKLGTRSLTAAHIEDTWEKLHPDGSLIVREYTTEDIYGTGENVHQEDKYQDQETENRRYKIPDYTAYHDGYASCPLEVEGKKYWLYIPRSVDNYLHDEFDYRFVGNSDELINMSVALFAGLINPSISVSSGGGGTSSELPWRDKDEDDKMWIRRCAEYAKKRLGVRQKSRGRSI